VPTYGPDVVLDRPLFIHPAAQIYGKVRLAQNTSVWAHAVVRAENFDVEIGPHSNVQDFAMIHVGDGTGVRIGAHCTITHHCTIHGARVGDNCLIGINATLMDGVVVGENSTVAGGAFLPEGTVIPPNSIVMGIPGKVVRTSNGWVKNRISAWYYTVNAKAYAAGNYRAWDGEEFTRAREAERARLEAEFRNLYGSAT
jgi:carbonic anhydrase/acetyltransferase-like protein (isoleucine patch superfamily)